MDKNDSLGPQVKNIKNNTKEFSDIINQNKTQGSSGYHRELTGTVTTEYNHNKTTSQSSDTPSKKELALERLSARLKNLKSPGCDEKTLEGAQNPTKTSCDKIGSSSNIVDRKCDTLVDSETENKNTELTATKSELGIAARKESELH
jgi:hypothetical protein